MKSKDKARLVKEARLKYEQDDKAILKAEEEACLAGSKGA